MPIYMIVKVYFVSEGISVATLKDIENMLKDLTKTELKKLLKRVDKELSGHPSDLKALLTAKRYANNHCHCTLCGSLNVKKDGHRMVLLFVSRLMNVVFIRIRLSVGGIKFLTLLQI